MIKICLSAVVLSLFITACQKPDHNQRTYIKLDGLRCDDTSVNQSKMRAVCAAISNKVIAEDLRYAERMYGDREWRAWVSPAGDAGWNVNIVSPAKILPSFNCKSQVSSRGDVVVDDQDCGFNK
jgi:hypothetical protein